MVFVPMTRDRRTEHACVLVYVFNVINFIQCGVCCFVALRLKSTAMVMAGRSLQLSTLFPGQA